jgi:hypothetical protein
MVQSKKIPTIMMIDVRRIEAIEEDEPTEGVY